MVWVMEVVMVMTMVMVEQTQTDLLEVEGQLIVVADGQGEIDTVEQEQE